MTKPLTRITDGTFQGEVLGSAGPVLVDFSSEWCGPCRMVEPIVEELADEYEGRLKVGLLDTSENPMTPLQYDIAHIPTLLLFKGGEIVERIVGARTKSEFRKLLDRHL